VAYKLPCQKLTVIVRDIICTSKCTNTYGGRASSGPVGGASALPQTLAAVAVVVEWIIASDSLVADRDVLQVQQRDWK
jgi:hypothetical protein